MKFRILATLAICIALAACSKNDAKKGTDQGGQQGPEWTLSLKSTCTDGSKDSCLGYYGFAVDAAGKFTIGAEHPSHAPRVRALAVDEAQAVEALVKPLVAALKAHANAAEKCVTREEGTAPLAQEHTLTINRLGEKAVVARESVKDSCTSLLEADAAQTLLAKVQELATSHYPTPYPDACLDSIDQFEAKYTDLQKCTISTDCGYIGENYDVIPYDANQVVFMEDYSKVTPVIVGNAAKITAQRDGLIESRDKLRESCGESMWRNPIPTTFRQFYSNAGNPLCEQGSCKVNPAVFAAPASRR